jgi:hypothetical protein
MNPCRPAVAKDATMPRRALRFGCARRLLPFLSLPLRAWRNLPRSNRRYTGLRPSRKLQRPAVQNHRQRARLMPLSEAMVAEIPPTKTPMATCLSTGESPSGSDEDRVFANATPIGCANYAVDSAARERWFLSSGKLRAIDSKT